MPKKGIVGRVTGRAVTAMLGVIMVALSGCSEPSFPRDSEGSLVRAMADGVLRVGASENPPWSEVADDGTVTGVEAEIIQAYAASMGTEIMWTPGAESQLILTLDEGDLDVVIGGIRADSPWSAHAALTRPYARYMGPDGKMADLVFACRLGENALLSNLERFLINQGFEP